MNKQNTDTRNKVQGTSVKVQGTRFRALPLPLVPCISPRPSKGFTLIELVVTFTVIAILAGLFLNRIRFYQEQAEKVAMEQVASALQSSLVLQYGHLLASGREAEVKNLATEAPILWLMKKPLNYAGEFSGLTPDAIEPGNWAFDLQTRELVYVPYRTEYFTPGKDGRKWVRYRARLVHEPVRGVAAKVGENNAALELSGVLFEAVEPYQWLERGKE